MPNSASDGATSDASRQAASILQELANVPPQHASAASIRGYREALLLLQDLQGSELWYQASMGLASHLLECPDGKRRDNVLEARAVYETMRERAEVDGAFEPRMIAVSGQANSILADPNASRPEQERAVTLLDNLLEDARLYATPQQLAVILAQAARAHSQDELPDLDRELEVAIQLQSEAVTLLEELEDPSVSATLGRAYHNLGRLHAERRVGLRSQNVDRAIHALESALALRPEDADPVGRARTLRALAVLYPEWSGADSVAHANRLAEDAKAEAHRLAQTDPREARRSTPAAATERQQSALRVNLDWLYQLPPDERRATIEAQIANHQEVLSHIDRDDTPATWADWMAGLGRLLGRLCHLGVEMDVVRNAYFSFQQAVDALETDEHIRLRRDIVARWGELCHEIGDFATSFATHRDAAEASQSLLAHLTDPDHRQVEIEQTRGLGLFGAYAAVQCEQPEEAARLAEMECNRSLTDLLGAMTALRHAPREQSERMRETMARIRTLESELRTLGEGRGDAAVMEMHARLVDYLGVDPSFLQARRVDSGAHDPDPLAGERARLRTELADQRRELRQALVTAAGELPEPVVTFGAEDIKGVAASTQSALIYVFGTVHGGAAVVVMPHGTVESLLFDDLNSDKTGALLGGTDAFPGYERALRSSIETLEESLRTIREALRPGLMAPLEEFLRARGVDRAVVVALGRFGVLPLHAACGGDMPMSFAPSARSLAANHSMRNASLEGRALAVANPVREDLEPLHYAVAEARSVVPSSNGAAGARVLSGEDATLEQVMAAAPGATLVHMACHGRFRPAAPLESHLFLTHEDQLSLAQIFSGELDLSKARLVTLSACETGSIESRRASDESIGFPTALMVAGVPAVVSATWSVRDATSMFFMMRLYELLFEDGLSLPEAVGLAREWLRDAPVHELSRRTHQLRTNLEPEDAVVDDELAALINQFQDADPDFTPFHNVSDWCAFFLTGA